MAVNVNHPEPRKSKHSGVVKFFIGLLIVILIVGLIGAGYLTVRFFNAFDQTQTQIAEAQAALRGNQGFTGNMGAPAAGNTATPSSTPTLAVAATSPLATPMPTLPAIAPVTTTVSDGQYVTQKELTVAVANAIATARAETPAPTATPVIIEVESSEGNPSAVAIDKVEMVIGGAFATPPTLLSEEMINGWNTQWFAGATDQMKGLGKNPWPRFPALHPSTATIFPDTDNPLSGFIAAHGLEYGEDESQHCGSFDDLCSIVIPPMSYVLMSGNSQNDLGSCLGAEGAGCAWMFTNVGLSSFELKGWFDNVFIIQGRYWHGDFLPEAIVEGLSHVSWNMTNGDSQLNPNGIQNAGGNCSSPGGCEAVINQFFVTSGAELLIYGATTYRP